MLQTLLHLVSALAVGVPGSLTPVSEAAGSQRENVENMAFECLNGDRQIECLLQMGFRCASAGKSERNSYSCSISHETGCYEKRFRLKEDGWSSSDTWIDEECGASQKPPLEPGIQRQYDDINAPDELAFQIFVQLIFNDTLDDIGDLDAVAGNPDHTVFHFIEAGLTGKMEPVAVVRYFAERYLDIEREVETLSKKLLCNGVRPRFDGAENFMILDQLDDVRLHVYQRYLFLARADLQASGLFDIDKILREFPVSFSSVSIDHEVAMGGSIPETLKHVARLCEGPWGHTFNKSESSVNN